MKKACILMGSPRKDGNTSALVKPFELELEALGFCCSTVNLYEKELKATHYIATIPYSSTTHFKGKLKKA